MIVDRREMRDRFASIIAQLTGRQTPEFDSAEEEVAVEKDEESGD